MKVDSLFDSPIQLRRIKFLSSNKNTVKTITNKRHFSEKWGNLNEEKGKKKFIHFQRKWF